MHDYHFQLHYCHVFLQSEWPALQIIEAKNCRYLIFTLEGQKDQCIDLDTKSDMYGLFVTSGKKPPVQVDMTNVNTEASYYLSHGKG
jgi:hypothetical protein